MASAASPDVGADGSASASEKSAKLDAPAPKLRSCVVCRRRKVRCDKADPCSNCRRGRIACVYPSSDRPPRWARRLERTTADAASPTAKPPQDADPQGPHVMERLRNLESLVRELSGQLEQANAAANAANSPSPGNTPSSAAGGHTEGAGRDGSVSSTASTTGVQKQLGRMVLKDANRSRYISSDFWSRVDDELYGLKVDLADEHSDSSDEDQSLGKNPPTHELDRTPPERHAFLFGHNLGVSRVDSRAFHPLPSQIPFLLNIYSENVNLFTQIVHMPTLTKIVRDLRGADASSLPPAQEALLFAVYYAAVTSMEEDDVMNNFGTTKGELNLKFRLGLEHALASSDFLNVADSVVLQAFTVFLSLARRHDSPRFVWMMVGLAIRMAQALGLQRDGSQFKHLSPYEVEIRRRVWWAICMLDVRASEDQGTDYTIGADSFDTKLPLNIDDADLSTEMRETPSPRQGMTDMTFPIDVFKVCDITRRMMARGGKQGAPSLVDQSRLIEELAGTVESTHLKYAEHAEADAKVAWWVGIICIRLVVSKMTLMIYFPTLVSTTSEQTVGEIRDKLLVDAIQIAEWNHALNAEPNWRQWRWMYQTYTHWYAVVFLLIEVTRRPLSPIVERAWLALHSSWLIPTQSNVKKNLQFWVPLRKLTLKARRHREEEIERLRGDTRSIEQLELKDQRISAPASCCPFYSEEGLREHWRELLNETVTESADWSSAQKQGAGLLQQQNFGSSATYGQPDPFVEPVSYHSGYSPGVGRLGLENTPKDDTAMAMDPQSSLVRGEGSRTPSFKATAAWAGTPFLWADPAPGANVFGDMDVNMDIDSLGESYWFDWAKNMESTGS